jgi:hypothetical protein
VILCAYEKIQCAGDAGNRATRLSSRAIAGASRHSKRHVRKPSAERQPTQRPETTRPFASVRNGVE